MEHLTLLMAHYGLLAVFICVLLEELGLPFPAYPCLMLAGALAGKEGYDLATLMLAGITASLLADVTWFVCGRLFGVRALKMLCRFSFTTDACTQQTARVFGGWGLAALTLGKLVPGFFSTIAVLLAGIAKMSVRNFLLFDVIGSGIWVGIAVAIGAGFHNVVARAIESLAKLGAWSLVPLLGGVAIYMLAKWWERRRLIKSVAGGRISADALRDRMARGDPINIFDLRPARERRASGVIPGAQSVDASGLQALAVTLAKDVEVVMYCACPNEASAAREALRLQRAGFSRVRPLHGGIDAWIAAGYPIEIEPEVVTASSLVPA